MPRKLIVGMSNDERTNVRGLNDEGSSVAGSNIRGINVRKIIDRLKSLGNQLSGCRMTRDQMQYD